jgi:hypothetical protein
MRMIKAFWVKNKITVYIHEDRLPNMKYNKGKYVVSKQPNSLYVFCVDKDELKIV